MRFRPSLLPLEARWMPDGAGDPPPDDPLGTTDAGTVDTTGETDGNGDTWYGDQDPPPPGGGDPPPDDGDLGGLGDFLDDNPGAGVGGPYVGP